MSASNELEKSGAFCQWKDQFVPNWFKTGKLIKRIGESEVGVVVGFGHRIINAAGARVAGPMVVLVQWYAPEKSAASYIPPSEVEPVDPIQAIGFLDDGNCLPQTGGGD
jgi:hypothetical protein